MKNFFTPLKMSIAAIVVGLGVAVIVSCSQPSSPPEPDLPEAQSVLAATTLPAMQLAAGPKTVTPTGLTSIDTKLGDGDPAKSGDNVSINYIGKLYYGGVQFDSSYDRGQTLDFQVGDPNLIPGFSQGVTGMKVGGKREVLIPPDLAYGPSGRPPTIPPNAPLVFDLELMKINK